MTASMPYRRRISGTSARGLRSLISRAISARMRSGSPGTWRARSVSMPSMAGQVV
ncbi:hypothetical protein ACFQ0O_19200 [Saccharopolyspora spinosporotrichia]